MRNLFSGYLLRQYCQKLSYFLGGCVALVLLSACDNSAAPDLGEPQSKPVKTLLVSGEDLMGVRQFPGRVQANQTANLSFRVPGVLQELPVKEGERVELGQLLARLDPTDYTIAARDYESSFRTAKANFERAKTLIGDGYISRSDYDQLQSRYDSAQAALDKANQNLAYTQLVAPFAGVVAKRFVDNFEEVQAMQAIVSLNNPDLLEIAIQMPEGLIQQLDRREPEHKADDIIVTAQFPNLPDTIIPLVFKEISTTADSRTQTFAVTFTMPKIEELTILPGMTATVTLDLSKRLTSPTSSHTWVPVSAVMGSDDHHAEIFVVDEATMTLEKRAVTTGTIGSASIEIIDGVKAGERIVVAGVPFLQAGQAVTLMPDIEQAAQ